MFSHDSAVPSAKSRVTFVENKTVFPQTTLQGFKNQLHKCFEKGQKLLMLGEEEGEEGRTETDYEVKRADSEKVLFPNGEWNSTKETVLIRNNKKYPLLFMLLCRRYKDCHRMNWQVRTW